MNLENTTIIVANLGELKAYEVNKHEAVSERDIKVSYSLKLLTDVGYIATHQKMQDINSDRAGKFGNSSGEEHSFQLEKERRTLEDVASDIDNIVNEKNTQQLFLAFSGQRNGQLVEKLNSDTKSVLIKNIPSDLVKTNKNKILSYFQ